MKLEDLTALGIAEDAAKKALELHTAELTAEQAKTTEAKNQLTVAQNSINELTGQLKAFDGVDVEKLKADVKDWETKYNTDLAEQKKTSAVEMALVKAGAKDSRCIKALLDNDIIKLDDKGELVGLTEQLDKIKTEQAYLFGTEESDKNDTGMTGSTGGAHGEASKHEVTSLAEALEEHYNEK